MIDWIGIGKSASWVVGLAVVVASLSWASWLAVRRRTRLRSTVATPGVQVCLNLGLALVSAGLLVGAQSTLEGIVWLAFLLYFAAQSLLALRSRRSTTVRVVERSSADRAHMADTSFALLMTTANRVVRMEPWLLLALTPFLMFPSRLTPLLVPLLVLPWIARKLTAGCFTARTPLDGPIMILLLMLPISLRASMDIQRSMPKLYGIILGLAVFYAIVNHVRRPSRAWGVGLATALVGLAVSALALVGTDWPVTTGFASLEAYRQLASLITDMGGSLAGGFHPNEVAAVLSLFIPFVASLLFLGFFGSLNANTASPLVGDKVRISWSARRWLLPGLLAVGLLIMGVMLILTDSRSAMLGTGVAVLLLCSFRPRWLWPALALGLLLGALAYYYMGPEQILNSILALGAERNVSARFEIWQRALYMIQDFPYTGVGLNTFSLTANVLYPVFSIPPERVLQLTHAHNAFLQVAVDVGIPGLIAYLALLMSFGAAWWTVNRSIPSGPLRAVSVGLLCSMVAYHVYGLTDCITLGAKPGVAIWAMLGLMAALVNLPLADREAIGKPTGSDAEVGG